MATGKDAEAGAEAPRRGWLRRHRRMLAVASVVLVIAVRVALPSILRSVLVSQTNAALSGRIEVGDVDLWLLAGGVALKDVALHGDGAGPTDAPLVAFRRLYVNLAWLPFFHHTVRIQEIALDGLALNVDRLKDGALVLPKPREAAAVAGPAAGAKPAAPETTAPEAKPAPPATQPATPWNVVIDTAALLDGHLRLRDHVSEPPENAELALDGLTLNGLTLQVGTDTAPGHGVIEAKFGDGTVRVETNITTRAEGFAVEAKIDIENLPLDRSQRHIPQLGWVGFAGRLDAKLAVRADPGKTPVVGGTLALRDLQIDVPGVDGPALAWKRFDLDVDTLDVETHKVVVKRVALDHAGVVIRAREPVLLPLLNGLMGKHDDATAPAPPPAAAKEASAPWTWKVGTVEIADSMAKVLLEPPPLEIKVIKATVTGLSSEPGSSAKVALEVGEGDGTLAVDGTVGLDPLAAQLHARIAHLALSRLVAATGAAPVLLPGGALDGELTIAAEHEPLVVSGKLALADLRVAPQQGQDFSLAWKGLEVDIKELRVPGVLPGAPPGGREPLRVDLNRLRLVAPIVVLTRTPEGLAFPGATAGPAPGVPSTASAPGKPSPTAEVPGKAAPAAEIPAKPVPAADTPAAKSPPPADSARPLAISVAKLDLENGEVSVLDRTVKPFYRGKVSSMTLHASGLRIPENTFDDFVFTAKAPGNAPVSFKGKRTAGGFQLDITADRLPLTQFNPYVTQAAGYSIATGTGTIGSKVTFTGERYESTTSLRFDRLDVAGAEGDSLFTQHFGIPLTLALGLMKDLSGVIALSVPVSGDRAGGARVDLGSIVAQALQRAILGAVTSPLKLLGAVAMSGSKVEAFAPEPIGFGPGRAEVADDAWWRIEQLVNVLGSYPGLKVALRGGAGTTDVRALQDAAVLAELQADQGVVGTLKNLPARAARNAVRDALVARAAGKPGELPPDRQTTLDEWAAKYTIADTDLQKLAAARATRLQGLLAKDYGVGDTRVSVGEPEADREKGQPAVRIAIH